MKSLTIGILGDGQLARMSAQAAAEEGHKVVFYGQYPDGPCQGLGEFIQGTWDDRTLLDKFATSVDVVTLENEFVDGDLLESFENIGVTVYPSSKTFKKIETKLTEKQTFEALGIPVVPYVLLKNAPEDLETFASHYGYPIMLKSSKGGYDGYGNFLVTNKQEALEAFAKLGGEQGQDVLAEKALDFEREVAITIARNSQGKMVSYPVCDTIQEDNICNLVCSPSNLEEDVMEHVRSLGELAMQGIDGVGVFSFEFFITHDGKAIINESAPRPHNSAHYTMDACETSQFRNHILAITGERLGSAEMSVPRAVMLNILGTQNGLANLQGAEAFKSAKDVYFHLYGKKESRIGRKMGHVNLVGRSREQLIKLAKFIESNVRV